MSAPANHSSTPAWRWWAALAGALILCAGVGAWLLFRTPPPIPPARAAKVKKAEPPPPRQSLTLTPAEEQASFVIDPRFRVELVASEPLVKNPVALAFDPNGRVWVCEMQGYMPDVDAKEEGQPIGRVVFLEDTDGDGRMDKSTVFLDGLVLPRAIALVRDGVLVGAPPSLLFCRDRDGDGRADEQIEVDPKWALTAGANPEHMANGLLWAMDNWIYSANSTARYRLLPDGTFERKPTSFRGQWGLAQDDAGRLFYNYHISHLHADITPAAHYLDRNPHAPPELVLNPKVAADQRVWPGHLTPGVNSGAALMMEGQLKEFTSACGPVIYRGELFPLGFQGSAFVCEPVGNLIRRAALAYPNGVPFSAPVGEQTEFLTSSDERFRPVNLYTGPDGALWVADMYNGIVEHKAYMSRYLRKDILQRGLEKTHGLGRIWRIVPKDAPAGPLPKVPHATTEELLAELAHPNGWRRDTAQRLLVEGRNLTAAPALRELLETAPAATKLQALWTLDGLGLVDAAAVLQALGNSEPKVRAAALRLGEPFLATSPELTPRLLAMVSDLDPDVQMQLMLSLGELGGEAHLPAMLTLLVQNARSPYLQMAVWTGLAGRELPFLRLYLASPLAAAATPAYLLMLRGLLHGMLTERDPAHCLALLEFITQMPAEWPRRELMEALVRYQLNAGAEYRPIALEREPLNWSALQTPDDTRRAALMAELFAWPGKPSPLADPVAPLTPEQEALFTQGQALFSQVCAACHQPDGRGLEGLAPPLVGSEWVLGNEQRLTRVILHGLAGQIFVRGRTYSMEMPPLASLSDEQIAAVLTYLRRAWDHTAPAVETTTIAAVRAKEATRDKPWSARALSVFK